MGIPTVVSMPFRASASFLQTSHRFYQCRKTGYQCPFGLKLHFYLLKIFPLLPLLFLYQCPFGLGLHFYRFFHYGSFKNWSVSMPFRASTPFLHVSAISPDKYPLRYQCPLGLKLHFYEQTLRCSVMDMESVSMPFRAKAPFLQYLLDVVFSGTGPCINALSG